MVEFFAYLILAIIIGTIGAFLLAGLAMVLGVVLAILAGIVASVGAIFTRS